jgi:hypothetical protein
MALHLSNHRRRFHSCGHEAPMGHPLKVTPQEKGLPIQLEFYRLKGPEVTDDLRHRLFQEDEALAISSNLNMCFYIYDLIPANEGSEYPYSLNFISSLDVEYSGMEISAAILIMTEEMKLWFRVLN